MTIVYIHLLCILWHCGRKYRTHGHNAYWELLIYIDTVLLHLLFSDYVTMPPRPKRLKSPKKGLKTKSKRKTQPRPDPVSFDGFVTKEEGPTLKDVINTIGSLVT